MYANLLSPKRENDFVTHITVSTSRYANKLWLIITRGLDTVFQNVKNKEC